MRGFQEQGLASNCSTDWNSCHLRRGLDGSWLEIKNRSKTLSQERLIRNLCKVPLEWHFGRRLMLD